MNFDLSDLKTVKACLWMGPLLTILFFIGFVPLMGFLPPPLASDSADTIAKIYQENTTAMRIGPIFLMAAVTLFAPWGVAIAALLRNSEGRLQVLNHVQLILIAVGIIVGLGFCISWGAAAFRPHEVPAEVIRLLNDIGWFFFLYDWPPFVLWFFVVGAAILKDKRQITAFPRWCGFLSFWAGILSLPAGMMIFFKSGPFAFHGLLAMYVPLAVFFIWIVALSWEGFRTIKRYSVESARST